jgi:Tol biopolymer transport system component
MNRGGGVTPLPLPPNAYFSIRLSPDGKRLAFDTDDGREAAIWIYDLSGAGQPRRLTHEGRNRFPVWSADSRRVVFQSDRDGGLGLYWQGADTGAAERLTTPEAGTAHVPDSWSPTADRFSFSVVRGNSASLWTFSVRDKQASRFGNAQSTAPFNSDFSHDGRWLAYTLRDGISANIFVEPFPATGDRYQITTGNGHHPVWLPVKETLSYRIGDGDQFLVEVSTTSGFSWGNPRPALAGRLPTVLGVRSFDITRDGNAFLAVAPISDNESGITPVQEIRIVQNWTEELKRLVLTK